MGGTNAHVIVEQPPPVVPTVRNGGNPALVLSGRTPDAVRAAAHRLAVHLAAHPKLSLADVADTLRVGRCAFGYRTTVTAGALNGELAIEQVPPDEPAETLPQGRRVSLPGYPFAGERLWIDAPGNGSD
jgi:acyl transferase domain-containing protein